MNKNLLNLQCLVGNYLNGFKIVSVEKDPFIKDQINLVTNAVNDTYFGDKRVIKFYVRNKDNAGASIYKEQVTDDKYILNEFEKWLEEEIVREINHPTQKIYCNCCSCKNKNLEKLQELKGVNNEYR